MKPTVLSIACQKTHCLRRCGRFRMTTRSCRSWLAFCVDISSGTGVVSKESKAYRSARWKAWYRSSGRRLKERYGITADQYQEWYDRLKGCCEICRRHFPRLDVDHNHLTNVVRGLLCRKCNLRAGFLEDALTEATLSYLSDRVENVPQK